MLHTDVEGHQTHPIPALSISALELKASDRIRRPRPHAYALRSKRTTGHLTRLEFEVTNISEARESRGVFLVEVNDDDQVSARYIQDYRQRPFQRLRSTSTISPTRKTYTDAVLEQVKREAHAAEDGCPPPIIEITLAGRLGIPLELQKIREQAQTDRCLHIRLKNHSSPVEYAVAEDVEEDASREKLEQRVIEDLIVRDNRFKTRREQMARLVIGVKRQALSDEPPEKIIDLIATEI